MPATWHHADLMISYLAINVFHTVLTTINNVTTTNKKNDASTSLEAAAPFLSENRTPISRVTSEHTSRYTNRKTQSLFQPSPRPAPS